MRSQMAVVAMGKRNSSIGRSPRTVAWCFWLVLLLAPAVFARPLTAVMQARKGTTLAAASPAKPGVTLLESIPAEASKQLLECGWTIIDTPGVEDNHFDGFEALVLFELPRQRAFQLLAQTERQREYHTDVDSIQTIEYYDDGPLDEHRMRIMFFTVVYRIRYHIDFDARRMRWNLDPDFENSFEAVEGFWELYELDDERTLARFGTVVKVGSALPAFMQDIVSRSKLPASIDHSRRWVNSGGTYRP